MWISSSWFTIGEIQGSSFKKGNTGEWKDLEPHQSPLWKRVQWFLRKPADKQTNGGQGRKLKNRQSKLRLHFVLTTWLQSSLILALKNVSAFRPCTDFWKVNTIPKPDVFPLPRMEDCVVYVSSAKYVRKFDLLKGYWQVSPSQRAPEISAFKTPSGLYSYTVSVCEKCSSYLSEAREWLVSAPSACAVSIWMMLSTLLKLGKNVYSVHVPGSGRRGRNRWRNWSFWRKLRAVTAPLSELLTELWRIDVYQGFWLHFWSHPSN